MSLNNLQVELVDKGFASETDAHQLNHMKTQRNAAIRQLRDIEDKEFNGKSKLTVKLNSTVSMFDNRIKYWHGHNTKQLRG